MTGLLDHFFAWSARRRAKFEAQASRAEQTDGGIGAEAPIRKASEDRLRRTDFATRIAGVLSELSLREGRVFAIRGGWGFGKSSLKNLISEQLDAMDNGAAWLDFNPWQWGDGDAIARALFGQMADRLGGEHSKAALARAEALRHYGSILTGASAPIKEYGGSNDVVSTFLTNASVVAIASAIDFSVPAAAGVAAGLAILSVVTAIVGRVLSHLGQDHGAEPLEKVREALDGSLRKLDRPLVVFVDDIDRLEPEQIRTLLRQVKANANLPNIVFVLLFQPSIVEGALDPVAGGNGRLFLEKIVQANFDLPAVPVSIVHNLFAMELSELASSYATEKNGFSDTRWGNAFAGCIKPMLRNVRDARRLISSIGVHLPLHSDGEVFEVNIVDFLILETLRVFEPDLHQAIFRERELVLQEGRHTGFGQKDQDKVAAEKLLGTASEERRSVAKDALIDLFPPLEWAFGGTTYADGFHPKWLSVKRTCTSRYFPRYFELQTAAGEMSESRFIAFLEATGTENGLMNAVADIESEGLLPSLVSRLDESVDRLPVENAAVLLPGMFRIAQKFAGLHTGAFDSPWISAWRATSWFLKRIPKEIRDGLALDALRDSNALSVAAMMIYLNDPAARTERETVLFDPALKPATVEAMKIEWLRLMRSRAEDIEALLGEQDLIPQLYRWRDYAGSLDQPRNWVTEAIQTDKGFAIIATRMMSVGTSHSAGDQVAKSHNMFHKENVEDFIGLDTAKARYATLDPASFPDHEEALRTLHHHLEIWTGSTMRGPFDF